MANHLIRLCASVQKKLLNIIVILLSKPNSKYYEAAATISFIVKPQQVVISRIGFWEDLVNGNRKGFCLSFKQVGISEEGPD
jgi:hypothetical protein